MVDKNEDTNYDPNNDPEDEVFEMEITGESPDERPTRLPPDMNMDCGEARVMVDGNGRKDELPPDKMVAADVRREEGELYD